MSEHNDLYTPRGSEAGRRTGSDKALGFVETPSPVAVRMVRSLNGWPGREGLFVDPGYGNGEFVLAALWVAHERGADLVEVARRIVAIDIVDRSDEVRRRLVSLEMELNIEDPLCPVFVHEDFLSWSPPGDVRWVAGNPPYLESKRMSDALKAHVKGRCPVAGQGAFDLYGAFVEKIACMAVCGVDARVIVPNRILTAKWAAPLRRFVLEGLVVTVGDEMLGNTFPGTSVYPVIIGLGRPSKDHEVPGLVSGSGTFMPASLLDRACPAPLSVWPMLPEEQGLEDCIIRALTGSETVTLDRVVDVRWCVSFHRAGLRDDYVFTEEPKTPHARKFVGGVPYAGNREVGWLALRWGGTWIDYDEERARADKNPLPPVSLFDGPKLVVCQNARRLRCVVDTYGGYALKDTFLALIPRPGVPRWWLWWLALVVSSDVFHLVYEACYAGSKKGGGYLSFLPATLSRLPIPKPHSLTRLRIMDMYDGCARGDAEAWREVEVIVSALYGLDERMRDAIAVAEFPPRD